MGKFVVTLEAYGNCQMLMHSDRLADPLNPATKHHKSLTSKRNKTDQDILDVAKSEWQNSLYYNEKIGVYLPVLNIRKSLIEGARLNKLGKSVERGVFFEPLDSPLGPKLIYQGPRDIEKMWEKRDEYNLCDSRSVVVGRAKIYRYRPSFSHWKTGEIVVEFDENVIDMNNIIFAWNNAGRMIGLGDFRPLFGQYIIVVHN